MNIDPPLDFLTIMYVRRIVSCLIIHYITKIEEKKQ